MHRSLLAGGAQKKHRCFEGSCFDPASGQADVGVILRLRMICAGYNPNSPVSASLGNRYHVPCHPMLVSRRGVFVNVVAYSVTVIVILLDFTDQGFGPLPSLWKN
jgi:hypothetical protein